MITVRLKTMEPKGYIDPIENIFSSIDEFVIPNELAPALQKIWIESHQYHKLDLYYEIEIVQEHWESRTRPGIFRHLVNITLIGVFNDELEATTFKLHL